MERDNGRIPTGRIEIFPAREGKGGEFERIRVLKKKRRRKNGTNSITREERGEYKVEDTENKHSRIQIIETKKEELFPSV